MANSSGGPGESTNIQWMYEGANSKIDREAYLLGKRITKATEDKGDFIVEDKPNENLSVTVLEKLDYESKLREDPLISIRQKEQEKRRELLSNPIKRKHLQTMLKSALEKDLNESSKHKKKKRKSKSKSKESHKKKRKHQSSSSDSSSSSDEEQYSRSEKIMKHAEKNQKLQSALKRALEKELEESESSGDEVQKQKEFSNSKKLSKHKKHHSKKKSKKQSSERLEKSSSLSDSEHTKKPSGYGLQIIKEKEECEKPVKARVSSPVATKPKYQRKERPGFTKKLSKEELEKKRQEMMSNAGWRDEQRKKNIKQYSMEEKHEKAREDHVKKLHDIQHKRDGKVKTFLHDMKLHQTNVGSLEDTVRRKRHTLNKSSDD